MKQVSDAYAAAMAQEFRNQSVVTVILKSTDTSIYGDGSWSSNGEEAYSSTANLDYERSLDRPIATLELNKWVLDGSNKIYNSNNIEEHAYISSAMSDSDGVFSTPPTITRTFTEPHTLPSGFVIWFDRQANEYPRSFEITLRLNGYLVQSFGSTGMYDSEYSYSSWNLITFDEIELKILDTYPYYRARVEEVFLGLMLKYTNDQIISVSQINDVDPLSRRLPTQTASVSILDLEHYYDPDNPDGLYSVINEKTQMSITYGYTLDTDSVYTLTPDWYILTGNPSVLNGRVTFNATKLLGWMNERYYKRYNISYSLEDMAVDIVNDANVPVGLNGYTPILESGLTGLTTKGVPDIDTHAVWLQMIAHAACCKLYCNSNDVIVIQPFDMDSLVPTGFYLNFDSITFQSLVSSKSPELKSVQVAKYSYIKNSNSSTLYEETTDETEIYGEFQLCADSSITLSTGSLVETGLYAQAIDVTVTSGSKTITVTGKTLQENSTVYTKKVSDTGEVDLEQNKLITSKTMQKDLANHAAKYLALRDTYDFDYRGNPELEPGDVITIQTSYSDELTVMILRTELSYNGALSGHLKVKVLS